MLVHTVQPDTVCLIPEEIMHRWEVEARTPREFTCKCGLCRKCHHRLFVAFYRAREKDPQSVCGLIEYVEDGKFDRLPIEKLRVQPFFRLADYYQMIAEYTLKFKRAHRTRGSTYHQI